MKKVSDVFKSIRYAKVAPKGKPHASTDDEEHAAVGEKEFDDQLKHVKKMAGMAEEVKDKSDEGEYDREGDMAKSDLRSIVANAQKLHDMIDDADNLPEWCQSKITLAEDYVSTVANYMTAEMNEEVIKEGRPSQRHPLEGHEYHRKSDEALIHIAKDAHAAAEAMKSHNTDAENKYRDQANDSATVRHYRKTHGMADWYKKKYGHIKEEDAYDKDVQSSNKPHDKDAAAKRAKDAAIAARKKMAKEEVEQIDELSTELLGRYKKAAGAQASAADKAGDFKKGDKRFSGIVKATKKQFDNDMKKEEVEQLEEKNVPTSPEKWAQAKAQAKAKFDVYPSAYANGWAAKKYKEMGGGWKSVSESKEDIPFDPPYKKVPSSVTDKSGAKHGPMSTVRHLARQAMKKQAEKMKPVKESLDESRKAEIVKEIVKKKKEQNDKFESDPVLSSQIVKEDK